MRLYSCLSWQPIRLGLAQKCVSLAHLGCELQIWLSLLIVSALFMAGAISGMPFRCYVTFKFGEALGERPRTGNQALLGRSRITV